MTCNDSAMASVASGGIMTSNEMKWEKLSPAEFQQLQDFAACKSYVIFLKVHKILRKGFRQRKFCPKILSPSARSKWGGEGR